MLFLTQEGTVKSHVEISKSNEVGYGSQLPLTAFLIFGVSLDVLWLGGQMALAVGAPGEASSGVSTAAFGACLVHLDENGDPVSHTLVDSGSGTEQSGPGFGSSVATAGDLDRDGIMDIVVGAPDENRGGEQTGAIYVIFMKEDGQVKGRVRLSNGYGGIDDGMIKAFSKFGSSIAAVGDLDLDGVPDLAVGAAGAGGVVFILFLSDDGSVRVHQEISKYEGQFVGTDVEGFDLGGSAITLLGDMNGDGVPDLAVGSPHGDVVRVLFMNETPCLPGYVKNPNGFSPTACVPCVPGTYQGSARGSSELVCIDCSPGTFQAHEAQVRCETCPAKSSCVNHRQTVANECPDGASCLNPQAPELRFKDLDSAILEHRERELSSKRDLDASNLIMYEVSLSEPAPTSIVTVEIEWERIGVATCIQGQEERIVLLTERLFFGPEDYHEPQAVRASINVTDDYHGDLRGLFSHSIVTDDPAWQAPFIRPVGFTLVDDSPCAFGAQKYDEAVQGRIIRKCGCAEGFFIDETDPLYCNSVTKCETCPEGMACGFQQNAATANTAKGYHRHNATPL